MNPKLREKLEKRIQNIEAHLKAMQTAPSIPQYAKRRLGPANKWLAQELKLLLEIARHG